MLKIIHFTGAIYVTGAMILAFSGCGSSGPALYPVSGEVTFDGRPVPEGDIAMISSDSAVGPAAGKIRDGQFHLEAPAGKKRVEIRAPRKTGEMTAMGPIHAEYIPACYNSQSTLTADVRDDGQNVFRFKLQLK